MKISNVHFVWHTIAWTDKNWPAYDPLKWYPGDGYVDWVGISFFDSKQDKERNMAAKLAKSINKPLMVAESSPFNQYAAEAKLEWISLLFEYIKKNDVKFLSYINVNWDSLPLFKSEKWGDARLETNPILFKEWNNQVKKFRLKK
jgi:beta-mannanase